MPPPTTSTGAERSGFLKAYAPGLVLLGIAMGLGAAFGLSRSLSRLMFGAHMYDAGTWVGVTLLLLLVAVLASYIPARRATRVDPTIRFELIVNQKVNFIVGFGVTPFGGFGFGGTLGGLGCSTESLNLALRAVTQPGDTVAVESPPRLR